MENAVKALLIAAAVLIAILLISMVMGVFNTGSEQIENAGDLSEYQIQQFNDKFTQYEGTSKSGADVNALLDTVFNHNNSQEDTSTCITVTVDSASRISQSNAISESPTKVSTGNRYTVKCTYNTKSKLITSIAVTTNK